MATPVGVPCWRTSNPSNIFVISGMGCRAATRVGPFAHLEVTPALRVWQIPGVQSVVLLGVDKPVRLEPDPRKQPVSARQPRPTV